MKPWFQMEVSKSDATVADVFVYDAIGGWFEDEIERWWGIPAGTTAKTFIDTLNALPADVKSIVVHINSPGGDVFAAATIANVLREQHVAKGRSVEAVIEGLSASAATVLMMGAQKIRMSDNALLFLHEPFFGLIGNAKEMRKGAEELDKVSATIISAYQWHSPLEAEALKAMMEAETYLDASEAVEKGLVSEKVTGARVAACFPMRALALVPEKYRDRVKAFAEQAPPAPQPAPAAADAKAILAVCREHECTDLAESFLNEGHTIEQVTAKAAAAKAERQAAKQRETDITAACKVANLTSLAGGYVRSAMSVADVKAALTDISALVAKTNIDSGLKPSAETTAADWSNAFDAANGSRSRKSR